MLIKELPPVLMVEKLEIVPKTSCFRPKLVAVFQIFNSFCPLLSMTESLTVRVYICVNISKAFS